MNTRRRFIQRASALLMLAAVDPGHAASRVLVVYKGPQCDCCAAWEKHLRAAGFRVDSRLVSDLAAVKRGLGVPADLWTCHTGVIEGYLVEGHVPAGDVLRLLRERPKVLGIAVPGMPLGSPGMEQGPSSGYERFETVAFTSRGSRVFAKH